LECWVDAGREVLVGVMEHDVVPKVLVGGASKCCRRGKGRD
jgi:hypothetical protein